MSGMTRFNSEELTKAVHAALRASASVSSGSMHFPYKEGVIWDSRRAQKSQRPLQWILERDTFEREVVSQYAQLEYGVVRELIAGTGVGKTTVMPFVIAQHHQVNGIIVVPKQTYALRGMKYLTPKLIAQGGHVRVALLRSSSVSQPIQSPVVYYTDAETLLGRVATNPSLLRDLGVDFIFLDESHEGSPGYRFFPYAVTSGIISGVKIFYGTATGAGDLSMETGGVGRKIVPVDPSVMSVENSSVVSARSPLHHSNITNRTIVHLATDAEIVMWHNYYVAHDIPSYPCEAARGHRAENGIDDFLEQNPVCVLLVYAKFRTSITANLDTSICGGYIQKAVSDFVEGTVSLRRVPVTSALRVQGCGRVGRYKPGVAYYSNVDPTPDVGMDDDTAFGVYLWSVVFNIRINEPTISQFSAVVGESLSSLAASVLLHSRLPPLTMLPYVGNRGFFAGWDGVAQYVLFTHGGIGMCDVSDVDTTKWTEYSTGAVPYVDIPYTFRAAVRFPREWNVIPAYAWELFRGNKPAVGLMRAASVISAVPTEAHTVREKARLSVTTLASDQSLWTSGRTSMEDVNKSSASLAALNRNSVVSGLAKSVRARTPTVRDVQQAYSDRASVRDSLPFVSTPVQQFAHSRQSSVESVPRPELSHLAKWQNDTALAIRSPPMHVPRKARSDSSDDRSLFTLMLVDPVKYKYYKLYPMDTALFERLMEDQTQTRTDKARVGKLLNATVSLGKMRGDAATRDENHSSYLLSVLRVHNAMLLQKAQLAANRSASTRDRVVAYMNGDATQVDTLIDKTARLLLAFQLESYFVGIDERLPRSSLCTADIGSDSVSPDYDYDESRARIMLCFGPPNVITVVDMIVSASMPVIVDEKCVGNAWAIDGRILSAQHVCADGVKPASACGTISCDAEDDYVVFNSTVPGSCVTMRDNVVEPEHVYIITYDSALQKAVLLGDYMYLPAGDIAYVNAVLDKGSSGALLISVDDGAVLGMYVAYFGDLDFGPVSLVVPAGKFIKYFG